MEQNKWTGTTYCKPAHTPTIVPSAPPTVTIEDMKRRVDAAFDKFDAVFTRTKKLTRDLSRRLDDLGYKCPVCGNDCAGECTSDNWDKWCY